MGPCKDVIIEGDDIDLSRLPIQSCWPGEPAPLITRRWSSRKGLASARKTISISAFTACRCLAKTRPHAVAEASWRRTTLSALENEKPDPLPACHRGRSGTILAVTPVPDTLSEYQFAGLLRGRKVDLVDCKTVPLKVPAEAEIVIEGHVSLQEYGDEGPYGDHTGYYNSVEQFPVFNISVITMRRDPIYLTTFTGRPPDEPSVLGEGLNEVFIPLIQQQFPEISDFWLPPEGCSYRIAVIAMKKAYPAMRKA